MCHLFRQWKITQLATIISRDDKITHGLFGGPWGLGALGPGPAGPLDKTALHAEYGHQMYFGGSVVGEASTIGIRISPAPLLIFTGCQKVQNLASFKTSLNFELHTVENAPIYPNSETKTQCCDDRPVRRQTLVKLGLRIPEKALSVLTHHLKSHAKTR